MNVFLFVLLFVFPHDDGLLWMELNNGISGGTSLIGGFSQNKYSIYADIFYIKDVPITYMNEDSVILVQGYRNYQEGEINTFYNVYNTIDFGGVLTVKKWDKIFVHFNPFVQYRNNNLLLNFTIDFSALDNISERLDIYSFYIKKDRNKIFYIGGYITGKGYNGGIILSDNYFLYPLIFFKLHLSNYIYGTFERGISYWKIGFEAEYKRIWFAVYVNMGYPYWSLPFGGGWYISGMGK